MGSQLYDSEAKPETVLLVGIQKDRTGEWSAVDSLNELRELCATAGAIVVDQIVCRLSRPHPGTYIGSGKAQEIADLVKANSISTLVFDEELSPAQGRNLEKIVATVPVKRLGQPSEIASIIAWLASEEGGYATGADFSVNGGLHMG